MFVVSCLLIVVGSLQYLRLQLKKTTNHKPQTTNHKQQTKNVMSDTITTDKAAVPLGVYPHAKRVGNLLFLSGIGSRSAIDNTIPGLKLDDKGNKIGHDIEAECHACFANVREILIASGSSWDKIVDVTVFLTDMQHDFPIFNKIYANYFQSVQATRTTVEVRTLPTPISIELKVIASV